MKISAPLLRSPRFWMPVIGSFALLIWVSSSSRVALAVILNLVPVLLLFTAVGLTMWFIVVSAVRFTNRALKVRPPIEDRLDELERLKRRDLVTPEEYAAKRQEILKDL